MSYISFKEYQQNLSELNTPVYNDDSLNQLYKEIMSFVKTSSDQLISAFEAARNSIINDVNDNSVEAFNNTYNNMHKEMLQKFKPIYNHACTTNSKIQNHIKDSKTTDIIHTPQYAELEDYTRFIMSNFYELNYRFNKDYTSKSIQEVNCADLIRFFQNLEDKSLQSTPLTNEQQTYYNKMNTDKKEFFNSEYAKSLEEKKFTSDIATLLLGFSSETRDLNNAFKAHELCSRIKEDSMNSIKSVVKGFRYDASGNPIPEEQSIITPDFFVKEQQKYNIPFIQHANDLNVLTNKISDYNKNNFNYETALDDMQNALTKSALFMDEYDYEYGQDFNNDNYRRAYITHRNLRYSLDIMKVEGTLYNELRDALGCISRFNTLSDPTQKTDLPQDKLIDAKNREIKSITDHAAIIRTGQRFALELSFKAVNRFQNELDKMDWKFLRFNSKEFKNLQKAFKDITDFTKKSCPNGFSDAYNIKAEDISPIKEEYRGLLTKLKSAADEYIEAKGDNAKHTDQGQHRFEFAKLISGYTDATLTHFNNINEFNDKLASEYGKHQELKETIPHQITREKVDFKQEFQDLLVTKTSKLVNWKREQRKTMERGMGL